MWTRAEVLPTHLRLEPRVEDDVAVVVDGE